MNYKLSILICPCGQDIASRLRFLYEITCLQYSIDSSNNKMREINTNIFIYNLLIELKYLVYLILDMKQNLRIGLINNF